MSAAYRIPAPRPFSLRSCSPVAQSRPARAAPPPPPYPRPLRQPAARTRRAGHSGWTRQHRCSPFSCISGGALARAGHNHVIASHDIERRGVGAGGSHASASFEVHVPVNAAHRRRGSPARSGGAGFSAGRAGGCQGGHEEEHARVARCWMGERYPEIVLQSEGGIGSGAEGGAGLEAQVRVIVRDQAQLGDRAGALRDCEATSSRCRGSCR